MLFLIAVAFNEITFLGVEYLTYSIAIHPFYLFFKFSISRSVRGEDFKKL